MIRISQLKLPITHSNKMLEDKICQQLKIQNHELLSWNIIRRSIDARKKPDLKFVYTIDVETAKEKKTLQRAQKSGDKNIMLTNEPTYQFPTYGTETMHCRPVIIGCGPAGLFCAWLLARMGFSPIVLERGDKAAERQKKVDAFWNGEGLHPNSNVQFGEGGAGTFSDGKLNTSVKDPSGRNYKVLELLVNAGAPKQIIYDQKPHLGTDVLIEIITNMRHQIEEMGGSFYFNSQVTDMEITNGSIRKIQINHKDWMDVQVVVSAIGHSARDTFFMMKGKGLHMEAKSFAVGVRVEHPQEMINESQYGLKQVPALGAASYKLTHQLANGHGVYSFCMCPGGHVVNASSEEGFLAINGMSYHARASQNANSAMIVTVNPQDYYPFAQKYLQKNKLANPENVWQDPLAGMYFQRFLEQAAYLSRAGKIPVQTFEDFCKQRTTTQFGDVLPCMKGDYEMGNLTEIFPEFIHRSLAEGISACGGKIKGFDRLDAILSGVESRTSSPIKVPRNENFESNVEGFYPCGEGAGYAGGITSAAMDGLRVAEVICRRYAKR